MWLLDLLPPNSISPHSSLTSNAGSANFTFSRCGLHPSASDPPTSQRCRLIAHRKLLLMFAWIVELGQGRVLIGMWG